MKRAIVILGVLAVVGTLLLLFRARTRAKETPGFQTAAGATPRATATQKQAMPRKETESTANATDAASLTDSPIKDRLRRLEALGRVPDGADMREFELAQQTSWWGRRLDSKTFWKDRVVWLDRSAKLEANQHGRLYPPMPY